MAATVKPILTPALTQEYAGMFLINLLASVNQIPAAPTDYFVTQLSDIPLIRDKFNLTPSIELILVISNPMGEVKIGATVVKPLNRPLNLWNLNTLAKFIKPEWRTPKGIHVMESPFA